MIYMKKSIVFLLSLILTTIVYSQDAYFSNFYRSYSLSNPSGIVLQDDINLTVLHRSQWTSIVQPFSTSQFEGYYGVKKANTNEKLFSIGFSFINERLGNNGYLNRNNLSLTGAYNIKLSNTQHLSAGLKLGYFNGSTDINALTSGSQFQNGFFQSSNPLGENISNPIVNGLEISPSVTWYQHDAENHYKHFIGITAFNINNPRLSSQFQGYNLPPRFAISTGSRVYIKDITLLPRAMASIQGNQTQIIAGSDVVYSISENSKTSIGLGGYYRLGDAAILSLKYLSKFIDVGIAYDFSTSPISDPLNTNGNSFELFADYKIKQKDKIRQFELLIEVFDDETKESIKANATFKNLDTKEKGVLFKDKERHYATLNEKQEFEIEINKPEYENKKIIITGLINQEINEKVYLSKLIKLFDFELDIYDKETNEPLEADITLLDQNTGEKKLLEHTSEFRTQFEVGEKYTLSLDAEEYDNSIVEIRYNKYGTLSKTAYLSKTKPKIESSKLVLIVKDESTLELLPSTIMAINTSDPINHSSSLIALNELPPKSFDLEVGQQYEILFSKEGYFNKTIKIDNMVKNDILKEVLLTPIEVGKSIIIEDLLFKTGKNELDKRSYRLLDQMVDFMSHNSTIRVEIAGHTDSDGSESFNQKLSEGRAQSAVNYLISKGISEARLVAKGYGETIPLEENDTNEHKAKNRRVELKIIGK
ncbi:MAG: hypothetical protein CL846_01105 [Crocinitomicaceae bacterium]|nr:hypothetical protein [Crocinitomicaceae bacterium]